MGNISRKFLFSHSFPTTQTSTLPSLLPSLTLFHQGSREQLAIGAFAASLLIIPTTLAVNAAKDSSELVAQLRSRHAISQRTPTQTSSSSPSSSDPKQHTSSASGAPSSSSQHASGADRVSPDEQKQLAKQKNYRNYGLDLTKGRVHDCVKAGVLEPSMSKIKQLKSAVEACVAIMRIDTMIKLDPEQRGGEDDGHGH